MIERINSEAEFREFALRLKREHGRIEIRVTEAVLVGKFFVKLSHWCKDFPGGGFDAVADFVTKDKALALRLMQLEKGGPK